MQFTCPTCSVTLALPDDSVGRKAQCPSCQAVFRVSEPLIQPDRQSAGDRISATTQPASIKPERTDAVACPGCDKLLAFNAASAGQVVICPSCQRRIRMPTAAEMQGNAGLASSGRSLTGSLPSSPRRESMTLPQVSTQPASWRSDDPYETPAHVNSGRGSSPVIVNYATPGMFLVGVSVLNLAYDLLWSGVLAIGIFQDQLDADAVVGFAAFFAWALVAVVCHALSLVAGWKMTQRRSLSTARLGSILALVPCGVCGVIQIPFGIWAVAVLYRADASEDFAP